MTSFLLAGLLLFQDPGVSFECRGTRAEEVLEKLSPLCGRRLMTSPATRDEILILSVKDVPVKTLLDRIAEATCAEWTHESDGWRLIRSPKLDQEQEARHYRMEADRIREGQAKLRKSLQDQGAFDSSQAKA